MYGCKKSDPPTYTVKGWIGNVTTNAGGDPVIDSITINY
jgi:hypothetical protein